MLNRLPKRSQPKAKSALQAIWMAASRDEAKQAFDAFAAAYSAKYPKAVETLQKDREELLAFYDFPAEHRQPIRTTNPIESTIATVRLRDAQHDPEPGVPSSAGAAYAAIAGSTRSSGASPSSTVSSNTRTQTAAGAPP